jgi:hypothetical protein
VTDAFRSELKSHSFYHTVPVQGQNFLWVLKTCPCKSRHLIPTCAWVRFRPPLHTMGLSREEQQARTKVTEWLKQTSMASVGDEPSARSRGHREASRTTSPTRAALGANADARTYLERQRPMRHQNIVSPTVVLPGGAHHGDVRKDFVPQEAMSPGNQNADESGEFGLNNLFGIGSLFGINANALVEENSKNLPSPPVSGSTQPLHGRPLRARPGSEECTVSSFHDWAQAPITESTVRPCSPLSRGMSRSNSQNSLLNASNADRPMLSRQNSSTNLSNAQSPHPDHPKLSRQSSVEGNAFSSSSNLGRLVSFTSSQQDVQLDWVDKAQRAVQMARERSSTPIQYGMLPSDQDSRGTSSKIMKRSGSFNSLNPLLLAKQSEEPQTKPPQLQDSMRRSGSLNDLTDLQDRLPLTNGHLLEPIMSADGTTRYIL